jgi:hypothetical protein
VCVVFDKVEYWDSGCCAQLLLGNLQVKVLAHSSGAIVRVQVAPGRQQIDLVMPETLQERAGKIASVAGLLLAAMTIVKAGRRHKSDTRRAGLTSNSVTEEVQ